MEVLTLTLENFEQELNACDTPMIVDFWAEWCGPCKMMAPVFDKLAAERPDIRFARCNVDACYPIAEHFGVSAIPTFLLFENGKETGRTAGYQSGEDLLFSLGI